MYIHPGHKVAYIAHPKTASSSTAHAFRQIGFEHLGSHHDVVEPPGGWEGWRVVSTIRQPLDLVVSWYFHYARHNPNMPDFNVWLRRFLARPGKYLEDRMFYGLPYSTHILAFEVLDTDWQYLLDDLGLPEVELPIKNVGNSQKLHYSQFYTDSALTTKLVAQFERDFQDYGALART